MPRGMSTTDAGNKQQSRKHERRDGPGAVGPAVRPGGKVVAVAVGERHDGHAVEDSRQAEGGYREPSRPDEIEVLVLGPEGIDPRRGDHEMEKHRR